jgi:fumarate reductase (CoM/CoB) subunit B
MENGKVSIFRYNPESDSKPHYEAYEFPFEPGMSVLDVAFYIYENLDGTFSFSYCCRNSHCGLCGAVINGKAGLMCRESATREMTLEPLRNLTVIRDLIVDRQEYENHRGSLRLFLDRVSAPEREPEKIALEDLDRFKVASRCVECYSCVSGCPVVRENRHEFLGPANLVQLARHAFDPRDELNREVAAYSAGVYNCTHCGQCSEVCPHEIAPAENIEMLRAQLVAKGRVPRVLNELIAMVRNTEKAITLPKNKQSYLQRNAGTSNSKVGLFVGCNIDYDFRLMPIATAAVKVLQRLGINPAIPAEQVCCGTPLKEVGALEQIRELVIKNVEAFRKAGSTKVLTLCSGCGLGLKKLWPEVYRKATGQEVPFVVEDFTEFLTGLSWDKEGLKGLKLKVTYHDACSLRRGQGVYEEPRRLLRAIPELTFVEMPEPDYCCGGGGGLRVTNFEMAKRVLNRKMSFLKDLEVEAIVTGCPTCIKQLTMGLSQEQGHKVAVLHPAVVVAKAMGIG